MAIISSQPRSFAPGKLEKELTAIDAGVVKDIPAKTSITINGTAMTSAQIDSKAKGYIETIKAADTAKQSFVAAVNARRAITLEARDFFLQVKKAIIAFFGTQSPLLADFGLKPAKTATRTSHKNVVAAAKGQLTREARGTKGKKQKAQINPNYGTPLVVIGPDGKRQVIAPTVVNPSVAAAAGSTPAPSESGTAGGTPQDGAGNGTSPAAPGAGGGAAGGNA